MDATNLLIINGHPDRESFNQRIVDTYRDTALAHGANVRTLMLRELDFDPNLRFGYRKRMELEPDLLGALEDIRWSNHIVWVHPLWWYSYPALMKGFIDRLFLPGIAFGILPDGTYTQLFTGRSSRIICTGDTPKDDYEMRLKNAAFVQLKTGTLEFCGIGPVETTYLSPIYGITEVERERLLQEVVQAAEADTLAVAQ